MTEPLNVAAVTKRPDEVVGSALGQTWTRDDCLASITLNVHYRIQATGEDLGTAQVPLSDGIIADAMGDVFAAAVEAHGGQPGDDGYPVAQHPQAAWAAAQTQIANGATAEDLVTLLAQAGPTGQKWGVRILREAYRTQVQ